MRKVVFLVWSFASLHIAVISPSSNPSHKSFKLVVVNERWWWMRGFYSVLAQIYLFLLPNFSDVQIKRKIRTLQRCFNSYRDKFL